LLVFWLGVPVLRSSSTWLDVLLDGISKSHRNVWKYKSVFCPVHETSLYCKQKQKSVWLFFPLSPLKMILKYGAQVGGRWGLAALVSLTGKLRYMWTWVDISAGNRCFALPWGIKGRVADII
jgi:hypothetical protein